MGSTTKEEMLKNRMDCQMRGFMDSGAGGYSIKKHIPMGKNSKKFGLVMMENPQVMPANANIKNRY